MSDSARDLKRAMSEKPPTWTEARADVHHGDKAYEYLASAKFNAGEPDMVKLYIESAHAHALLFLGDKVEEFITAMKACTEAVIESHATLDDHVQTAAQHLHRDARDLKAQLRVIQGEAA